MSLSITRRSLFEIYCKRKNIEDMRDFVSKSLDVDTLSNENNYLLHRHFDDFQRRWIIVNRTKKHFLHKYSAWLDFALKFDNIAHPSTSHGGRIAKSFSESSDRTKRRKTEEMRKMHTDEELVFASIMNLRQSGKAAQSSLIKEATQTSPTRATKILETWKNKSKFKLERYTADEALALIINSRLSKSSYLQIRKGAKKRGADIYPSYHNILIAKERCYPQNDDIKVTESSAEISLQALLDLTIRRILQVESENISLLSNEETANMKLLSKWGCDGSGGQSRYKQSFSEKDVFDTDMFLTSLVPLQIISCINEKIIWENSKANSTRYCHLIRFQFKKETPELIRSERIYIENQISNLRCTIVQYDERNISVKHVLILSMIDGKVSNALTETASSQKCSICGALPKHMNSILNVTQRSVNDNALVFGISPLHSLIRCFECLLHVAYRLDIQKWQARGEESKISVANRKLEIQQNFREKLGLIIDVVKQGGGTTNDGNTARKFFANSTLSAEITGLKEEIIIRFRVILQVISSNKKIRSELFRQYCLETAEMFIGTYSWFPMPVSVHKILIHGYQIVNKSCLPLGSLSEEPQESRNKDYRFFREHHTRKTSRKHTNEDLLKIFLASSDPVITSAMSFKVKKYCNLLPDAMKLLYISETQSCTDSSDSTSESPASIYELESDSSDNDNNNK